MKGKRGLRSKLFRINKCVANVISRRTSIRTPSMMEIVRAVEMLKKKRQPRQICSMYRPATTTEMSRLLLREKEDMLRTKIGYGHREIQTARLTFVGLVEDLRED